MFNDTYDLYSRIQYLENLLNNDITTLQNRLNNLKLEETNKKKINYNKKYYDSVKDNADMKVKYNKCATNHYNKIKNDPIKYAEYLEKKRSYRKSLKVKTV
jgi:hypothetical protein